jgi:EmrB/QacA subfamily drug resistance transporter
MLKTRTLVLASLGSFLAALDVVIVATALPVLQADLGASLADLEWTINAYNLVFACLMLTGAALGDRFGRRRMYVLGLVLFAAASAFAALSGSPATLIAARAAQGVGAAIVMPLTLTLISHAFPVERRGTAIGIWGGVTGLGVAAGPVLGGAVIDGISWQWIFWFNVPVALVVAALSAVLLKESRGTRPQLDVVGLLLIGAGLFALTWAPVRAPSVGWTSAEVVGAFAAGAVLVALFLAWERRTAHPMLPLAYFRRRGFTTANGSYASPATSSTASGPRCTWRRSFHWPASSPRPSHPPARPSSLFVGSAASSLPLGVQPGEVGEVAVGVRHRR